MITMTAMLNSNPLDSTTLVNTASPMINNLGAVFYFHPDTGATAKANGIDGFRLYVLGRGGVLGDAPSPVVASAFGWWNPETIDKLWTTGKAMMTPQAAAALYLTCAYDLGRSKLSNVEGLANWNALAEKVVAEIDFAGLPLSAGYAAVPRPEDAPGQAMHLLALLREHRGDVHLNAVVSQGLSPRLAHAIKRPDMVKAFGWGEEVPETTDAHRAQLDAAEGATNAVVIQAFNALNDEERGQFLAGLQAIESALTA
jgi:hypothetical protein